MKQRLFIFFTFLIFFLSLTFQESLAQNSFAVDYSLYERVLKTHVDDQGKIHYKRLKADRHDLDAFLKHLETINVDELSQDEQKAFWINAYNALTMQTIINYYPVKSIRSIYFGFIWKVKRPLAKGKYALDTIEHKILRPQGDPRIHFALNCASLGCPRLPQEPFLPKLINYQLNQATKEFINNPDNVHLDRDANTLYISRIFDWYENDFLVDDSDIISFIQRYINEDDRDYLDTHEVTLKEIKYDWRLNEQ